MSSRKTAKSRTSMVILLIVIIAVGISAYFYYSAFNTPQKNAGAVVVTEGWTKIGKDVIVSTGSANMTLIVSEGKGMLVDTGYKKDEASRVKDYLDKNGVALEGIILTHMHNDHIANLGMFMNDRVTLYKPAELEDGQEITFGSKKLKVLKTDGHTPKGSHVSVEIDSSLLIAGDVVLTDGLPAVGGSYKALIETLKRIDNKRYPVIVPGHGAIAEGRDAVAKNLEYLENASKKVEELIGSGGVLPLIEAINIEDCISGVLGQDEEVLKQVHLYNLTNIYQQIRLEKKQ